MSNDSSFQNTWPVVKLADIATAIQYGYTTSAAERPIGPRFLRITDIQDNNVDWNAVPFCKVEAKDKSKYLLKQGDIVFARTGATVGKSFLIKEKIPESIFASYLIRVRLQPEIEARYIDYFFKSSQYWRQISESQAGIGQPNVNGTKLAQLLIPLAPPEQQRLIVAEIEKQFSRLDESVANLKRVKANLKRYKAAVLKAAVEGKLTEEWRKTHPEVEPASELLKRILAERKKKWEETELAKMTAKGKKPKDDGWKKKYKEPCMPDVSDLQSLPKGWTWVALPQVAQFQNGRFFPSKEYSRQGVKLLRPGNLFADGTIKWSEENTRKMPNTWAKGFPEFLVGGNEIIMNLTAQSLKDEFLGRTCLTNTEDRCLLNQRLARISPLKGIDHLYLLYVLKAKRFRDFVETLNTGSLIQHMFTSNLVEFIFPLPPTAEQNIIAETIDSLLSIAEENDRNVDHGLLRAERLRQAILANAFKGRLT